jgi:hypothetical protein
MAPPPPSSDGGGVDDGRGTSRGAGDGAQDCAECARLLLEAGAPVTAVDSRRRTPLDYCVDPVLAAARGPAATEALRALLLAPPPPPKGADTRRGEPHGSHAAPASGGHEPPAAKAPARVEFAEPPAVSAFPPPTAPPPTAPPPPLQDPAAPPLRGSDDINPPAGADPVQAPFPAAAGNGERGD